jgi:hypothetical protein
MPSGCAEHSSLYRLPAASFSPWQARHRSVYFQSGRITQELLAQILAVRRPYLTGLMQDLPTLTIHDAVLRQVIERAREAPVRGR